VGAGFAKPSILMRRSTELILEGGSIRVPIVVSEIRWRIEIEVDAWCRGLKVMYFSCGV